jgi:hypothetical protein
VIIDTLIFSIQRLLRECNSKGSVIESIRKQQHTLSADLPTTEKEKLVSLVQDLQELHIEVQDSLRDSVMQLTTAVQEQSR